MIFQRGTTYDRLALKPKHGAGKTWLRSQRCLEDINNFWMAHRPQTMSELYSHLHEELQLRLDEAVRVGFGFALEGSIVPMIPKSQEMLEEVAA